MRKNACNLNDRIIKTGISLMRMTAMIAELNNQYGSESQLIQMNHHTAQSVAYTAYHIIYHIIHDIMTQHIISSQNMR